MRIISGLRLIVLSLGLIQNLAHLKILILLHQLNYLPSIIYVCFHLINF